MDRKEEYEKYCNSPEGKAKQAECLRLDPYCRLCNAPATVGHHRVYREVFGTEPITDLTSLCDQCHHNFHFPPSVEEVSKQVMAAAEKGTKCPTCRQHVQHYRRNVNSAMAEGLAKVCQYFHDHPDEKWLHIENYLKQLPDVSAAVRGDISKLRFFGLLEKHPGKRADGSGRTGLGRPTDKSLPFLKGLISVPKYAIVYNNEVLRYSEEQVTIHDVWDKHFNYTDLMKGLT